MASARRRANLRALPETRTNLPRDLDRAFREVEELERQSRFTNPAPPRSQLAAWRSIDRTWREEEA